MDLISLDDVYAASDSIAGVAVRTPLLAAPWAGDLWLKAESLQPTGSFKIRGAYHAVASLPADRRAAGLVTHSSGNHGQALAYAARAFGVPCVVVMPEVAQPVKVAAVRALGAQVVLVHPAKRVDTVNELTENRGLNHIPPFDHAHVIAGQGTVGLEILAELSDVDVVLVPVGGGGLAAGVATAVKAIRPSAAVIGVEPELAADAQQSLRAGRVIVWPVEQTHATIADGLRTNLSELTFTHLRAHLDDIVTVTEEQITATVGRIARDSRLVVEPTGAVAPAAYLYRRDDLPAGRTAAVLTGGNVDPAVLAQAVSAA